MIRMCGWCGEILGEKCPKCGCFILHEYKTIFRRMIRFECMRCGHNFPPCEGGISHTICAPCAIRAIESRQNA